MRARVILLTLVGLLGAMLVAVIGAPTASAAPVVPCESTFAGTVGAIKPDTVDQTPTDAAQATVFTATVPASSNVEDLDVTISATHGNAADLRFDIDPTTGVDPDNLKRNVLMNRTPSSGAQVAPLTFDDEASASYTATSPSGRYQPHEALSENDGSPAGGTWRLIAYNWNATTAATVNAWSITITYSVCDGDGDGAEDHVDNCIGLSNADQADQDGDRVGNPCDDDVDGDGVGIGDNCPTVPNADQAAIDGDSVGNACDVDDDGDDVADTKDSCPIARADTRSGCPVVASAVRIKPRKKALNGRLSSGLPGCSAAREVSVFKVRKGKDRRVARDTSSAGGAFKVKIGRRTGKFYAASPILVLPGVAECSAAKSAKRRVRR